MQMWIFFVIFGSVILVPSLILWLVIGRIRDRIVVLQEINGVLRKFVITDKILESGKITEYKGKKIKPVIISKDEIYSSLFRRYIIKRDEKKIQSSTTLTDSEIEGYLNNEDLLKLYLAGKFKDTLIALLVAILIAVAIGAFVNGYLTNSHQCILTPTNETTVYLKSVVRSSILNMTG